MKNNINLYKSNLYGRIIIIKIHSLIPNLDLDAMDMC